LHVSLSPQGLFVIMIAMVLASLVYSRRDLSIRGLQLANLQQRMSSENKRADRMIDPVTKVFPRGFLDDLLAREISLAERRNRPLALFISDVNNFKQVKARYGPLMGDYVLSQIATILQSCVRGSDYVVQYGEHQFLVLLPETDNQGSEIVRQRVHRKVSEWDRTQRVGDFPISVSLGWYLHVTGQTAEKDIAEADACMDAANHATQRAAVTNPSRPPQQAIPLES
jgi:diguanylate cyclase (GGDEF)-like protein